MFTNDLPLIIAISILIFIVVFASLYFHSRRSAIWRRFARRHRLNFSETEGKPRVEGEVGNHRMRLFVSDFSSDTGMMGVEVTEMAVSLDGLPRQIVIEPTAGLLFNSLATNLEDRTLLTGDDRFDSTFRMFGDDPAEVKSYLTPTRRDVLLRLADSNPGCDVEVSGDAVRIRSRNSGVRFRKLDAQLIALVEAAGTLNGVSRHNGSALESASLSP